ncbi:MAG: hypothetical protein PHQ74_05310 [Crocinitomicaceae bacterium]|nr:hypothetical protein [Crocinitomicaceae bacterium]
MQIKPIHFKIFQLLAEIAIPLLGYFFWGWGFYFILLFFLLDYLVFLTFSFVKHRKIIQFRESPYFFPTKQVLSTILILTFTLIFTFIALPMIAPFDFEKQTWEFLAYKEMGLPQGLLLLPLVIYGGYAQYKMQFLMNRKFTYVSATENWKIHHFFLWMAFLAAILFLIVSSFIVFPEFVYISLLLLGIAGFKWFF